MKDKEKALDGIKVELTNGNTITLYEIEKDEEYFFEFYNKKANSKTKFRISDIALMALPRLIAMVKNGEFKDER